MANERNGVGMGVANGITYSNRALSGELLYDTLATTDTDRHGGDEDWPEELLRDR